MTRLKLAPPSVSLLSYLADNLEPCDVTELMAVKPSQSILETLEESVTSSFWSMGAIVDETPAAVFGITLGDESGYVGCPWALFTPKARSVPHILSGTANVFVTQWMDYFECLTNITHPDNLRAHRWLKRMGFEFLDTPVDVNGVPFLQFFMGEPSV